METLIFKRQLHAKKLICGLRLAFITFLFSVSCSQKENKASKAEFEVNNKFWTDSIQQLVVNKYTISHKLDTLRFSDKLTLFYQENIENRFHLIEINQYDINDIYVRDSTYYITIWNDTYSKSSVELSFDSRYLRQLTQNQLRAILVAKIDRVEKIHFKINGDVAASDPSEEYYEINLKLVNARRVLLKGTVEEMFFAVEKKTESIPE